MTLENAYKIFNLSSSCTDEEISKKFKKLAMKHHPDVGGSEANFKILLEAKEVLLKRTEPVYNVNGRFYTKEEYDKILKEYYQQSKELLKKMEADFAHSNTLMNIRIYAFVSYIIVIIIDVFLLHWNVILHWSSMLLFWLFLLKTEMMYNLYLKIKTKWLKRIK
jgi:hypothetical protein